MASTTLTRPTLILKGPYKHSHAVATISRPLMALSRAIQSLLLSLQALWWPLHALSRTLQTLSCEILPTFFKIYTFTAHIVQKHFSKVMRGLLGAMLVHRGHDSAFKGCESVCKVRESACKCHKSTCEAVRVLVCITRESASRGLETVAEAWECLQGPLWWQKNRKKPEAIRYRS